MFRRSLHLPAIFFAVACVISVGRPAVADITNKPSEASNGTSGVSTILIIQKPAMLLAKRHKERGMGKRRRMRDREKKMLRSKPCTKCEELEGFVSPGEIDDDIRKMVGKYRGGGGAENVEIQQARGVIETGLYPEFIGGAHCPEIDSEKWAIDYSYKRGQAALHRGVDIPQPRGTPIRAVAGGVVVGRFMNKGRKDGIAVVLRHTPEQTGLTFWTYS